MFPTGSPWESMTQTMHSIPPPRPANLERDAFASSYKSSGSIFHQNLWSIPGSNTNLRSTPIGTLIIFFTGNISYHQILVLLQALFLHIIMDTHHVANQWVLGTTRYNQQLCHSLLLDEWKSGTLPDRYSIIQFKISNYCERMERIIQTCLSDEMIKESKESSNRKERLTEGMKKKE